jgi:hypothetical protein
MKRNNFILLFVFFICLLFIIFTDASADVNGLQISIAVKDNRAIEIEGRTYRLIDLVWQQSHFHVVLKNTSKRSIAIWEPDCPQGDNAFYIEIADSSGNVIHAIRKLQDYTGGMGVPKNVILKPGESFIYDIFFDQWWNVPFQTDKYSRNIYKLRAVYESTRNTENDVKKMWKITGTSRQQKIWIGKVSTEWEQFVIDYRRNTKE